MIQQLKNDMEELETILVQALDKTLKETRTKSGKNIFDLYKDRDQFAEYVADKMIESDLMDESMKPSFVSEDSTFFYLEYLDPEGEEEKCFSISKNHDDSTAQYLKEAEEAFEKRRPPTSGPLLVG